MAALERIGLLAALPQECTAILSWPGWKREGSWRGIKLYELERGRCDLRLAVGGMGESRALEALGVLLGKFQVSRVVSIGFAGALEPGLDVGEVAWVGRVFRFTEKGILLDGPSLKRPPQGSGLISATVVSLPGFISKERIRETLWGRQPPFLVDLESYALAQEAIRKGVEFWGIRAVSDEAQLDAGSRVAGWVDQGYRMRASKVIISVLQKPSDLLFMAKLFTRARQASRSLGKELRRLLL